MKMRRMTNKEKRNYIKENGYAKLVSELIEGLGMDADGAIDYVYDSKTMSAEKFKAKYFQ